MKSSQPSLVWRQRMPRRTAPISKISQATHNSSVFIQVHVWIPVSNPFLTDSVLLLSRHWLFARLLSFGPRLQAYNIQPLSAPSIITCTKDLRGHILYFYFCFERRGSIRRRISFSCHGPLVVTWASSEIRPMTLQQRCFTINAALGVCNPTVEVLNTSDFTGLIDAGLKQP